MACLESLRLAGAEAFEVFLVNNHASDGSGDTLQRYLRESGLAFAYLDPARNTGFRSGINLGVVRSDVLDRRGLCPLHLIMLPCYLLAPWWLIASMASKARPWPGRLGRRWVLCYY